MNFNCGQCGGALELPVGARFGVCPFCGSSVYFDRSKAVLHFVAELTLDEPKARAKLYAWMAGNETAKGLEKSAVVGSSALNYFPLWRFIAADSSGERQWCEPACATVAAGFGDVPLAGGALRYVSAQDMATLPLAEPEVRLESALEWLFARGVPKSGVRETSLVHLPLYEFPYTWRGRSWKAAVDAISGRILVGSYPTKAEAPYIGIAAIPLLVFFCLGMLAPNVLVRSLLFVGFSVPMGLIALAIVRKV